MQYDTSYGARRKSLSGIIIKIISILVLIGLAVFLLLRGLFPFQSHIQSPSGYQAVFLDNNNIYFGSIKGIHDGFMDLTNVYYLQQAATSTTQTQSGLSLIPLSTDLEGPQNEMFIPLSHIIFYEDLAANSKIVGTIETRSTFPASQ